MFRTPIDVANPEQLVDIGVSRDDGGFNPGSYPDLPRRSSARGDAWPGENALGKYLSHRLDRNGGSELVFAGVYAHEMFPQTMSP